MFHARSPVHAWTRSDPSTLSVGTLPQRTTSSCLERQLGAFEKGRTVRTVVPPHETESPFFERLFLNVANHRRLWRMSRLVEESCRTTSRHSVASHAATGYVAACENTTRPDLCGGVAYA